MLVVMVRIPVGSEKEGERLAERFHHRAGLVDDQPGFLGFELLKGDGEYISMTRWASRADLDNWMSSQGHAQAHGESGPPTGGGHPHGRRHDDAEAERALETDAQGRSPGGSVLIYEVVIPEKVHE